MTVGPTTVFRSLLPSHPWEQVVILNGLPLAFQAEGSVRDALRKLNDGQPLAVSDLDRIVTIGVHSKRRGIFDVRNE